MEYQPEQVNLPQEAYEEYQANQVKPIRNAFNFTAFQLVILVIVLVALFYGYRTEILSRNEALFLGIGILGIAYLLGRSLQAVSQSIVPTDVQMERLKRWVESMQQVGIIEPGRIMLRPEFRRQKLDGRYTNDYFYVKVAGINDVEYSFVSIMDPWVDGAGVIGMHRAREGFFTPPPVQDLKAWQSIADTFASSMGLGRFSFLKKVKGGLR